MKTLVQVEGVFKALLKHCVCWSFFLGTGAGYAGNLRSYDIKEYQEFFKDILLVIYYANPHYETIDFEKQLYSPVFKNIVFYGDRTQHVDVGEFEHAYEDGDHGNVRIIYTRNGYYLSKWIKDVLIHHPGYKGYIFMQDDCLMQFWKFLNLDRNKIWYNSIVLWYPDFEEQPHQRCMVINHATDPQYTGWFGAECGMPQLKRMFDGLSRLGLDEERATLSANFGENGAAWYMVDFFYLPGRFTKKALGLCDLFDKVFCEISIPTMLGAMDYLQNWEEMPFWWVCFNSGEKLREAYEPHYYWMHPLKFSMEVNRNFALKVFHEQFYDLLGDK